MRTVIATVVFVTAAGAAWADDCPPPTSSAAPPSIHVKRDGAQRVYVLDTPIHVCVHPPRPAVAIVPGPASVDYVWHDLAEDLVGHIAEALRHPPFEVDR